MAQGICIFVLFHVKVGLYALRKNQAFVVLERP